MIALQAKKIKNLIVIQNKIDLVNKEQAKKSYQEIKEFLKGKYDNAIIIPVSAQQDINLDLVYKALAEISLPERKDSGEPLFIVARSFDINRPGAKPENLHGTVLGGTLKQGKLKVGDGIEIKPGIVVKEANQYNYHTLYATVKKLYNGSEEVKELTPGGSTSIETSLDMALGKADALAGCVVSLKGKLPALADSLKVKYILFPEVFGMLGHTKVEPLKPSEMIMLSVNTSRSLAVIKRIHGNELDLTLKIPIVPLQGENVAIARNINNHWRLIGYGDII